VFRDGVHAHRNVNNTCDPPTFDLAVKGIGDIKSFTIVTRETMALQEREITTDQRCGREKHLPLNITDRACINPHPLQISDESADLGAVLERFRQAGSKLESHANNALSLLQRAAPVELGVNAPDKKLQGTDSADGSGGGGGGGVCHMIGGNIYTACIRAGKFWIDLPDRRVSRTGVRRNDVGARAESLGLGKVQAHPLRLRYSQEMSCNIQTPAGQGERSSLSFTHPSLVWSI
jgi:hypothetical protein